MKIHEFLRFPNNVRLGVDCLYLGETDAPAPGVGKRGIFEPKMS